MVNKLVKNLRNLTISQLKKGKVLSFPFNF
jgi:hypothetical protein